MSQILSGYGTRNTRPHFNGSENSYELWEVKFLAHLRLQNLVNDQVDDGGQSDGAATIDADPVITGLTDATRNARIFAELTLCLDDKSLTLVIRDARDKGLEALKILREHYLGSSKPRIISLYSELMSMKKSDSETATEYMLRAETTATALKNAKENISDSLLTAVLLQGLPEDYKAFATVVTQKKEPMNFVDFKVALRSYEESEKCRARAAKCDNTENVMKVQGKSKIICYNCNKEGHKRYQCPSNQNNSGKNNFSDKNNYSDKKWCNLCKNSTHNYSQCRNKNSSKVVIDETSDDSSFFFKISEGSISNNSSFDMINSCNLLVDCGATAHIINDESKMIRRDKNFDSSKHIIELADGSRTCGIVKAKGDANVTITDSNGNNRNVILKDVLCIPSYNQNIFSVQAATENGAAVTFNPNAAKLRHSNGTVFNISKRGKLYYLNSAKVNTATRSLQKWHETMGHCNVQDILKLESAVKGMHITDKTQFNCDACAKGKMVEYISRTPDEKATRPLEFIHCDLAGPVEVASREGSKYSIVFVDDYTGIIFVYFLKNKSDATAATKKFLADVSPFGSVSRLRCDHGTEFTCNDFDSLMTENKIKLEFSSPRSPHQNGTAERAWRTLFEMARCLLLDANLPKTLWNHAVRTAAYTRNRCYSQRIKKTPYELFHGKQPNISHMHIFGSKCYAYLHNQKKLDPRSECGIFIGYDVKSPAYLVYFKETNTVKCIRSVKFFDEVSKIREECSNSEENLSYPPYER